VTLELILALPILFIALLAVVEFGAVMANLQAVAVASREGGRFAARQTTLNATTATSIRTLVDNRLESAGFGATASSGVVLVHNVGVAATHTDGVCPTPTTPSLPATSVRVRVCVPLTRLAPNLLNPFGFSLTSRSAVQDATFDYEP
jgi:Flp pilus assembly protein TadG